MNRTLLGAGLGLACVSAMAQSSVTIGGTLDLAGRHVRNESLGSVSSLVSGSNSTSKLIVRGREDLGGGLSAGFLLDSTILGDSGGAGATAPANQFWDRNSIVYVGHNKYGEIRLGRDWVPTHLAWTGFDPFTTLGIASANTFRSFALSRALGQAFGVQPDATAANPTLRVSNAAEYFLPGGLAGLYGSVTVSAGEGGATAAGFTKGDGFRLGWTGQGVNVAAAQFTSRNATANRKFQDQVVGASYDFGLARVSVSQRRWKYGTDRTVNTLVGAIIPAGPGQIRLTYLQADQTGATPAQSAVDAKLFGAGYVYDLSRRTALYVHVARIDNDSTSTFTIPGGAAVSAAPAAANYFGGRASTAFEVGIRHNF